MPDWLRWLLALPVVSIAGAVAVRMLLFAGVNQPLGLIFPLAVTAVIIAAAWAAARVAPSHGAYVGMAVALADLVAFTTALAFAVWFKTSSSPPPPEVGVLLLAAGGLIGGAVATYTLARDAVIIGVGPAPALFADLGPQSNWLLAVFRILFPATALGATCTIVAASLPKYFPAGPAADVLIVLAPAVTVAAVAWYVPTREVLAARLAAGVFYALGAAEIVATTAALISVSDIIKSGAAPYILFDGAHGIVEGVGLICGATIGLLAGSTKSKIVAEERA